MNEERISVDVAQLTLSNSLQLTALVELLEEAGVLTQQKVLERMKGIRDRGRLVSCKKKNRILEGASHASEQ